MQREKNKSGNSHGISQNSDILVDSTSVTVASPPESKKIPEILTFISYLKIRLPV